MCIRDSILGKVAFGEQGMVFPLIVIAAGAFTAAFGVVFTRIRGRENGLRAIYRGFYLSALVGALLSAVGVVGALEAGGPGREVRATWIVGWEVVPVE